MIKQKAPIGKSIILLLSILIIILNSTLALATIDLVSPEDNAHKNQEIQIFEYYVNLDNVTDCTLMLNSEANTTDTNITNQGFNEFTAELENGEHSWSISCDSNDGNTTHSENSEQRTLTIDTIEPTIILVSPLNNTQINESSVEIDFIMINTSEEESTCDIILNNIINKTITAQDSQATTTTISPLIDGFYEWKITCYDQANNSETSETRIFQINATPADPEFSITIPKTVYNLGEYGLMTISAPNGTSIRVEVCPDKPGFVECEVPVVGDNIMNYPFQEYLPFATYEGEYILEAFFNYSGFTETQVLNYEIRNNININIETDSNPRKKVPFTLEASATGGVGKLDYTWYLSNGSVVNKKEANVTYKEKGEHTEKVVVKDAYNNTKNKSITIDVSDSYKIEIIVKDADTNKAVKEATVEIDDDQKETDTNGKAVFYVKKGKSDLIVLKENYSIYLDEIDISKDQTFTIKIEPLATDPVITLISPGDKAGVKGVTTNLEFKGEHKNELNCSIYINEKNDGFFMYLGSIKVKDASKKIFGITDLENITYWWKIECTDDEGNSATSQTWKFTVGRTNAVENTLVSNQESEGGDIYNDLIKQFEEVLDDLENLSTDMKESADTFGITEAVKDTIKQLKNAVRDIDSLNFRNDLTEEQKQTEKEYIITETDKVYQNTPIAITVLNRDSFVDYINKDELKEILEAYLEIKDIDVSINKKQLIEYLDELQQEIVISTKTLSARLTYADGTTKEVTGVVRGIKTYNITDNAFMLEIIPKDVAESADDVLSSQKFEVVKQDPIIRFELKNKDKGETTIVYYFEDNINLELLREIKTAIFIELDSIDDEQITGFSTKSMKMPKVKGIIFIPVLVILLGLLGSMVFVGIKYDGIATLKYLIYKIQGQKNLHYLNIILNDIQDALDTGEVERASSLYNESKDAYSELSTIAKNDSYNRVVGMAEKIRAYSQATDKNQGIEEIKTRINNIQSLLYNSQISPALEEYKQIEAAYNRLDKDTKELLHPTLVALGNKIQIVVDKVNQDYIEK